MTDTNIEVVATEATEESAKKSPAKKTTTTKKTTTAKAEGTTTAKKTTTKKATAEGETPVKKTTAKKAPAKKVEAVEEVVATEAEVVAPVKKAPAKKAPAKKKAVKAKAPLYINGRYVAEKTFAAKPAKGDHPYELTNNMIKITLVKSLHGRLDKQQRTLVALGLTKINHSVVKADNKAIRGMIFVVKHLVTVEEVK